MTNLLETAFWFGLGMWLFTISGWLVILVLLLFLHEQDERECR